MFSKNVNVFTASQPRGEFIENTGMERELSVMSGRHCLPGLRISNRVLQFYLQLLELP